MNGYNTRKALMGFLSEDIGKGDITSALLSKRIIRGRIISRQSAIIAGVKYAKEIFAIKKCKVTIRKKDGTKVNSGQTIMEIKGTPQAVLSCERTALNLISRMSGIATQTNELVKKIPKTTKVYATRKTAPGLRFFDKEAVVIGGGEKHRMTLGDMIMIKDNHLSIESLVNLIRKAKKRHKKIEVEVENQKVALLAAKEGASIIMLDNFTPKKITSTIKALKKARLRNKVTLEISGGINSKNISSYAKTGVEIISVGAITNSVLGIDLSLEV